MAQGAAPTVARGTYLIRNGAVITVDKAGVLPRADILVRDGRIEAVGPDLAAAGAETIDATDMIVMPGFVDTHYHMWSALGRNFIGDGFGYFAAKNATSKLFDPDRLLQQRHARPGRARQCRHHHRAQLVAQHAHARRTPKPSCARTAKSMLRALYSHGHVDQMPRNEPLDFASIDRVQRDYFAGGSAFDGLVTYGVNLRGGLAERGSHLPQGDGDARKRGLRIAIHAGQSPPNRIFAEDYEKRGWLGPKLLICHYLPASDADAQAMARTGTPLSFATHSEFRLGRAGDPRDALLRMRRHNVLISLSFDATSIAPPNMFETMRFT